MTKKLIVPGTFELKNILQEKGPLPHPKKPRIRKCELIQDVSKFKNVDEHAAKVAGSTHRFFRELIWQLIHGSPAIKTDLDRVRAIFQWLTLRDFTNPIFTEETENNTVEYLMKEFQQGQRTHAQIFQILCLYSGIYCKVVTGVAKGKDYCPGETCALDKFRHCWNVVFIKENWFPVDPKWGSRQASNERSDSYSDFYFLTDPDQLQLSHWSEVPSWQLVDRPISSSEFEHLPFVKPHFFKCGLNFISNVKAVIETRRGQVKWDIGLGTPIKFSYKLVSAENNQEQCGDVNLKDFVFHEIQNGRASFVLRSPPPGLYYLKLFAKRQEERSLNRTRFIEVLEYKVQIDRACIEDDPLPRCWDHTWGPGERAERFCIHPVQQRGIITIAEKSINFEINKTRPVHLLYRFCRNGWKESELQKCVKVVQDNDTKAYVSLALPMAGEYGLEIFAYIPSKPDVAYTQVCQYFISCQRRDEELDESVLEKFIVRNENRPPVQTPDKPMTNGVPEVSNPGEAPSTFDPKPLADDDSEGTPAVVVSSAKCLAVLEKHRQSMRQMDDYARKVCEKHHATFRDLLWDLHSSKPVDDPFTKVRILYLWLATKKVQDITFEDVTEGSPEETLHCLHTGRTTYAMAFHTLCRYSGIPSRVLTGQAKGTDYKPGQAMGGPGSNFHTWNVVNVDGDWFFVDIRFARRPIISNLTTSGDIQHGLDDHFFLTIPSRFIYTHFPDDQQWQLLEPQVTMEQFSNMPVMTPHFFLLGLDIISHNTYQVTSQGETTITLRYPTNCPPFHFTFSIHPNVKNDEGEGQKLNRYGMLEAHDGIITFRLRLPEKGSYNFFVYAKEDSPEKKDSMFAQVCEYKIVQEEVLSPVAKPFPPCAYQSWGPGSAFYLFGMLTEHTNAVITTQGGQATLIVTTPKIMQYRTRLVQFQDATDFEGYVIHRTTGNETKFSITAPGRGEFGFEIYAKDPDIDSKKMRHVAQYLVVCEEDVKPMQLPRLPSGFLGEQPMLVKHGIIPATHPDPIMHLDGNYVEIEFHTSKGMRFTSSMNEIETKRECSEFIFIQSVSEGIRLCVLLPQEGFFALCIHGNLFEDNSQQIPGLFNYLIHCKQLTSPVVRYPKQFGYWKEGCYMWEPLSISPKSETVLIPFRVRIPRAFTVAVVVDQDWTRLDQDELGIWEGKVELVPNPEAPSRIVLVASYDVEQSRFSSLLEYSV